MKNAVLLAACCALMYGWTLDHFFVSDDFLNYERNGFRTLAQAIGFFSTGDIDFYRPIARLHFGVLAALVGDLPAVWNGIGLLLHFAASLAAARLAASLFGRPGAAATWTGVFFAIHFIHVEPVLWASGVTSLYVTLFVLLSLLWFRRARESGRTAYRTASVLALAAALLSKETAVAFVPLLLLTTAWSPPAGMDGERTGRLPTLAEAAPYAVLLVAWLVVFLGVDRGDDSPYRIAVGGHVTKNLVFFGLGCFVPVRYWQVQDLWAGRDGMAGFLAGVLGDVTLGLPLAVGGAVLAVVLLRGSRDARLGFAWIPVAALPFLLLPGSGERFLYLPSFGACLVMGWGVGAALRREKRGVAGLRMTPALAAGLVALMVWGNLDRQADWRAASRITQSIIGRWGFLRGSPADQPIEFVGVPEEYRGAWVFRNGFDSMVRLYWGGRPYAREGELPEGLGEPVRMKIVVHSNGSVGMLPAHLAGEP